jgi:precorrin-6B methylase 1
MQSGNLYDADIYLVGLGVFELRQVTLETLDILKQARCILHLTSSHDELEKINPNTQDLTPLYWKSGLDWAVYTEIARHVVKTGEAARPTVFATEGNPLFFNDISWEIAKLGRGAGLRVQALPGISSLDVLPIQLGFDIGDVGVQILDATQLVMLQLQINPYLSTLLLQVGEFGTSKVACGREGPPNRFDPLVSHLARFFPIDHVAIFIMSASRRSEPTSVISTRLAKINQHSSEIRPGMTLYLPRIGIPTMRVRV